jgi:hypothetical protein
MTLADRSAKAPSIVEAFIMEINQGTLKELVKTVAAKERNECPM